MLLANVRTYIDIRLGLHDSSMPDRSGRNSLHETAGTADRGLPTTAL